jgi:hypothetical protein
MANENIYQVTGEMCRDVAESLAASALHFGLALAANSDLAMTIKELRWLGTIEGEILRPELWPDKPNRTRALAGFLRFDQARRVAAILERCRPVSGAREKVRSLRKQIDRLVSQIAPAHDTLFELAIAARLSSIVTCSFEEPDIVVSDPDFGKLGLACKRIKSPRRFRDRIVEGAEQISRQGFPGVVAVDVEPVIHHSESENKPISYMGDGFSSFRGMFDNVTESLFADSREELDRLFSKSSLLCGVVLCSLVTGPIPFGASGAMLYAYTWGVRGIPNLYLEGAAELVLVLQNALGKVP